MRENDDVTNAYIELRTYCDDLLIQKALVDVWIGRHPDYMSSLYSADSEIYRLVQLNYDDFHRWNITSNSASTFDPNDPMPANTAEPITAATFISLMQLALSVYELVNDHQRIQQ